MQNKREENAVMKNNKNAKIFDFATLQYYQDYDRLTETILRILVSVFTETDKVITLSKKRQYLYCRNKLAFYACSIELCIAYVIIMNKRSIFAKRIRRYIFGGTEEYRYRKQFSE